MIEVILFEPEIPQNTGNIGRICAFSACRLHLIHPLGFQINDRNLRRAGMDYWKNLELHEYKNWEDFINSKTCPSKINLLTTHAEKTIWEATFEPGEGLLFGNEGHGAPEYVHQSVQDRLCIPKLTDNLRSLNLAVSVGVAVYEAIRQIKSREIDPGQ